MKKIVFFFMIFNLTIFAQMGELEIMPHHIHFMDKYERIKTVRIYNYSDNDIRIDSIGYDSSLIFVRNNNFDGFPVTLSSNSNITIDVLLLNYFTLFGGDSLLTTIDFFNNGRRPVQSLNISVEFEMHHGMEGIVKGTVKDSLSNISGAKLYFFYEGVYLIDSTTTDSNGNYEQSLRSGYYSISAIKSGYYVQYGELKNSPLEADYIEVKEDTPKTLNFLLEKEIQTDISVSGTVYDAINDVPLNKAIVVVRKGKHNPTKIQASIKIDPFRSYTVITNSKGEFNLKNIQSPGDYYLQGFSQYYIPGYFNHMNNHEAFWQNADSVSIAGLEEGKNIYLDRDSSYGGGMASGYFEEDNSVEDSLDDALIYAVSVTNNKIYNYNFSQLSGKFALPDLPFGTYKLVADKIGLNNAVSEDFVISSTQDTVNNIVLMFIPTSVKGESKIINEFELFQNYPNPFNPTTIIKYSVPNVAADFSQRITLKVYDVLGKEIVTLINAKQKPGNYTIIFNASKLSSGIYFYHLKTSRGSLTKKMQLLK